MSFLKQFSGKELKYGYTLESFTDSTRVVKPTKLTKISLTPTQTKFVFCGTRGDILKWMEENSFMIVEYDTSEDVFSPPSSPRLPSSRSSSPISSSSYSKITFDLFGQHVQNSSITTDFYRPLHFAMNHLPWLEVILEIRPSSPVKDSKFNPIKRVILNSGVTLGEAAKALEKSWSSILPEHCVVRNSISSIRESDSWKSFLKSTSTSDNEEELTELEFQQKHNKFVEWLNSTEGKIVELPWIKRRDKSPELVPPDILHPYNMEEALSLMGVKTTKEQEAKKDEEKLMADLPLYESVTSDRLLERGPTLKRPVFYENGV
ncbi:hypothetical protein F8M41_014771 [Gigaspora margarita]|uniref:Uncharacterized protein n=1 Tax=Gigaspora margarita TaxID=4874 RepID=A0A8H3WWT3_GIGMA|nr:hypothetical protein F8M41_014771 [Gigaspora margarita]